MRFKNGLTIEKNKTKRLEKENKDLKALLYECMGTLGESVAYPDPRYQPEVEEMGERIGYGALMHAANWGWQQSLKKSGWPIGGEFTLGHCAGTVKRMKNHILETLKKYDPPKISEFLHLTL